MQQLVVLIHIIICVALVTLILLQQGKGANMGSGFGGGASNTVFGSRGPASFLMKLTGGIAAVFFITSLSLGYFSAKAMKNAQKLNAPAVQVQPSKTQTKPVQVNYLPAAKKAPAKTKQASTLPPVTVKAPAKSTDTKK